MGVFFAGGTSGLQLNYRQPLPAGRIGFQRIDGGKNLRKAAKEKSLLINKVQGGTGPELTGEKL